MDTKLYRNVDGEDHSFLVFHISDEESFSDLEKFTGGDVEKANGKNIISTKEGTRTFNIGDYVVYVSTHTPYSRVRMTLNKVRHILPDGSYLICKPDEFEANFKEVPVG